VLLPADPVAPRSFCHTNEPAQLRRCQLRESQFWLTCALGDLQRTAGGDPQLLRGLQADLAGVNAELEQEQEQEHERQQPAPRL